MLPAPTRRSPREENVRRPRRRSHYSARLARQSCSRRGARGTLRSTYARYLLVFPERADAPFPQVDTSDAFYLRLHRYPEVLEKRASRLERERLIHERSKLINELEELRGRAWVYAGTSAGGRAEEERQRRIKAMGEKLARSVFDGPLSDQSQLRLSSDILSASLRYDSLLPNQPRKSNFLNLAGTGAAPPGAPPSNRDGRTASPSLQAPPPSRRRSTIAHSTSRVDEPPRPPTPVSASVSESSGNRTTIRIKFGPASSRTSSPTPSSLRTGGGAPGTDLERYTTKGELRKGPKRDRRAERARAEERRRLGLKPRSSIDKATARLQDGAGRGEEPASSRPRATPVQRTRRTSAAGVSYNEMDDEEEDELDDNEEDMDEDEDEDQLAEDRDGHAGGGEGGRAPSRPAKLVRKRLPDSFFHSAALRDAVMASQGPNARRASTRVVYAFGQRLPDQALVRVGDFELCGGVAGNADDDAPGRSRTRLEEMVRVRMERHGEEAVILGGHVFPKSAVDAWSKDPLHDASMVRPHRLQESVQPAAPTTGTFTNANGSAFAAPLPAARSTVASPVASHPGSPDAAARPAPAFCSPLKRARSGSPELTSG